MYFDPNDGGSNTFAQIVAGNGMGLELDTNYNEVAGTFVNAMNILSNGNVGIGTNTPLAKLEINSTATAPNADMLMRNGSKWA